MRDDRLPIVYHYHSSSLQFIFSSEIPDSCNVSTSDEELTGVCYSFYNIIYGIWNTRRPLHYYEDDEARINFSHLQHNQ